MGSLKVWDGAAWQVVSSQGKPGSNTFVGPSTPPGTPNSGDLWYDTDEVSDLVLPITLANGGTGGTSAPTARASLAAPFTGSSAVALGAPTTGTYAKGDQWLDSSNRLFICTVAGTPGTWEMVSVGSELSYTEITSIVSIAANTEATAQTVISSGAQTYDGTPIWIEFFAARVQHATGGQILLLLWDGSTNLGWLAQNYLSIAGTPVWPNLLRRRLTPTAGSHTYRVAAWAIGGTAEVHAGTGTTGLHVPAYLRITRA